MPVLSITGPRQSGKTFLSRLCFPHYVYLSLEDPDTRSKALSDPRSFLRRFHKTPVILDEAQRVPDLFSYIQGMVDDPAFEGHFVLTGSQQFLLLSGVSQTLAGRIALFNLFPLTLSELHNTKPVSVTDLLKTAGTQKIFKPSLEDHIWKGMYPRVHDKKLSPAEWYPSYFQTYVERDVRDVLNIGDLSAFERFVRLCANRSGEILNLSGLAVDCGITHPTARKWLSVLEASGLVFLLKPHHVNFNKRLIKSPKLYFFDTGLLCYLLRIKSSVELFEHGQYGHMVETFIVSELVKSSLHQTGELPFYFWRDRTGHEVDMVVENGRRLLPMEIKSSRTFSPQSLEGLEFWTRLKGNAQKTGILIYAGNDSFEFHGFHVRPWSFVG